jgi:opacity protein-like surface antigen
MASPHFFLGNKVVPFTYALGLGMDVDLTRNLRLGANYRYSPWDKADYATQTGVPGSLLYNNLTAKEVMLTLSYIR